MIHDRLQEITKLQNSIELNKLNQNAKSRKSYSVSKISLPIIFLRDIHTKFLSTYNADKNQSNQFRELSCKVKVKNQSKTSPFQKT